MRRRYGREYVEDWNKTYTPSTEELHYTPSETRQLWHRYIDQERAHKDRLEVGLFGVHQTNVPQPSGYETIDPAKALMVMPYSPLYRPCGSPTEEC